MKKTLFLTAGIVCAASFCSHAALIHRYSFSNAAGAAVDGVSVLTDSVGGAHGVVRGAGASFTGTGLDLPGGSSATQGYGDLPNGLISGLTAMTIEAWVTIDQINQGWARIFDFGDTTSGELTGPGGSGNGQDYLFLSAAINGTDYQNQRLEVNDAGTVFTSDTAAATIAGQSIHVAVTWADTGPGTSVLNYWRDGVQQTTNFAVARNISSINDVNSWLGRSNWTGDANLDGTFDEFRIYNHALNQSDVLANIAAGPNTVIPEPSVSGLACLAGFALVFRRRRR